MVVAALAVAGMVVAALTVAGTAVAALTIAGMVVAAAVTLLIGAVASSVCRTQVVPII